MSDYRRPDGRYLDFEEVTEGSLIIVERDHEHNKYNFGACYPTSTYPHISFAKGDFWIVEGLANRPRVAIIRNLQRNVRSGIRVDELLKLDDQHVITVGPGPERPPRDD